MRKPPRIGAIFCISICWATLRQHGEAHRWGQALRSSLLSYPGSTITTLSSCGNEITCMYSILAFSVVVFEVSFIKAAQQPTLFKVSLWELRPTSCKQSTPIVLKIAQVMSRCKESSNNDESVYLAKFWEGLNRSSFFLWSYIYPNWFLVYHSLYQIWNPEENHHLTERLSCFTVSYGNLWEFAVYHQSCQSWCAH